ncbi:multicopper oxidase [Aspergillus fijiensis CBS 313.89]|uniref:Putative L-ascorbate oxidase n=1 Tax=Aspergillus fijiensis CBS 313.89 TaxID=1448319 RepID=A0A8G1W2Z0_9EURO|nr:putative L-ascorbate oxidase [Aspergillus fijiensis CBS 313.89]RAK81183.1 putative L-ascorbate oxidase [Aspergillus fijiensis CBS 313.89]
MPYLPRIWQALLVLLLTRIACCSTPVSGVSTKTVFFNVSLTWEEREVAGISRKLILTNGQFPAPTLSLTQGDDVEFLVNNDLPFNTTIHFHGIEQLGTPWSDGVPGLSQTTIKPGNHFLYKWKATQYGSYVYHAHTRGQVEDGLYGAIYIAPDESVSKPFHMITTDPVAVQQIVEAEKETKPLILSDWRRLSSSDIWKTEVASGIEAFCANALLINGKGSVTCLSEETIRENMTPQQTGALGGTYKFTDMGCMPPIDNILGAYPFNKTAVPSGFNRGCVPTEGETEILEVDGSRSYASYDLINVAGLTNVMFSADEHPVWVYAADGRYIEPQLVDAITIPIGARYSVLIALDKPARDYTVRIVNNGINQIINGTALLRYRTPLPENHTSYQSQPAVDLAGRNLSISTRYFDENTVTPYPPQYFSKQVSATYHLKVAHTDAAYGWYMGNGSFLQAYENFTPLLLDSAALPANATISTQNGTWVDIIISVLNIAQPAHPIHKHSNKFFVIGQGLGAFNYSSVAEAMEHIPQNFNLDTPQIRDTFATPSSSLGGSWLALRYQVVNPGAWLLHCHAQEHQTGGMALAILDGIDAWPVVPAEYRNQY